MRCVSFLNSLTVHSLTGWLVLFFLFVPQDFGQALDTSHPEHKEYLLRDLKIVNVFFGKKGVTTRDSQELVDSIVGGESESESWDVLEFNSSLDVDSDNAASTTLPDTTTATATSSTTATTSTAATTASATAASGGDLVDQEIGD